ncbi:MAG: transglutaminase family protein [Pseudomonadota bacterium]
MLYDIRLEITYRYAQPAGASRSILRMMPLSSAEQVPVTGLLDTAPGPEFRQDGRDFFGNAMTEVAHPGALTEIAFRYAGRVRRVAAPREMDLSCPHDRLDEELTEVQDLGPTAPHHFVGASERVRPEPEIAAFARDAASGAPSVVAAVEAVSHALHAEIAFDPTATDVTTDPLEAFRARRGVCQDMSHILIAGLRSIGIPAGYVSGFLRTIPPKGQERLEGADAMHAWTRAWCGHEAGWIEIDPTNDMRARADHIAVAVGRDYADVAPVKGALRSSGAQETDQRVDVIPVDAAP